MCFSVQVDVSVKKLSQLFTAKIAENRYQDFMRQVSQQKTLSSAEIKENFGANKLTKSIELRLPREDHKVFPYDFTNVMTIEANERVFSPMRYRLRPWGSKSEVPNKYNLYNARSESLLGKSTWSGLIGKRHGLFPFNYFYEWVEVEGARKLITFRPSKHEIMWAPCLWDEWQSPNHQFSFRSFALITTTPPPEVEQMGHDRCPIFLNENQIDEWLKCRDVVHAMSLWKKKEEEFFDYQWAE